MPKLPDSEDRPAAMKIPESGEPIDSIRNMLADLKLAGRRADEAIYIAIQCGTLTLVKV